MPIVWRLASSCPCPTTKCLACPYVRMHSWSCWDNKREEKGEEGRKGRGEVSEEKGRERVKGIEGKGSQKSGYSP